MGKKTSKNATVQSSNPFEQQWVKRNQTTIRKRSMSTAISQTHSKNKFRDKRIGERDTNLDENQRYLLRLQRERSRKDRKRTKFSLTDTLHDDYQQDEADILAEERQQQINEEEIIDDDDDDNDDFIKVKQPQSESQKEEEEEHNHRTHKEIMGEVILKSKMYRAQRQQEKHLTNEETAQLDEGLPQLMALLSKSGDDFIRQRAQQQKKQLQAHKSLFDDNDDDKLPASISALNKLTSTKTPQKDSLFRYEQVYQQLASEKRARPSERLLTEEERAEKEKESLLQLEKQRQKRMQSLDEEEEENVQNGKKRKRGKAISGDDLDDGFDFENDSNQDDDNGDTELNEDDHNDITDSDEDSEPTSKPSPYNDIAPSADLLAKEHYETEKDIPFVFRKCPSTSSDLQTLFSGATITQRSLILQRLQKCFALSLNPGLNKSKLERLLQLVLHRVHQLASTPLLTISQAITEINMLLPHIHHLASRFEHTIFQWARDYLIAAYTKLQNNPHDPISTAWSYTELIMLRAIGRLYPTSDLRHAIITPLLLLLSEALALHRITELKDVVFDVFMADVLVELLVERKSFSGELCRFVRTILQATCELKKGQTKPLLHNVIYTKHTNYNTNCKPLSLQQINNITSTPTNRAQVATAVARLCQSLQTILCLPHLDLQLSPLYDSKLPSPLKNLVQELITPVARKPLQLYTSNTTSLKPLNPRMNSENGIFRKRPKSSYMALSAGDLSQSAARIRKALRQEQRGLARDIRRQALLDGAEKNKHVEQKREESDKKDKRVRAFLEQQQATWKNAEKRQRKLSGKKW